MSLRLTVPAWVLEMQSSRLPRGWYGRVIGVPKKLCQALSSRIIVALFGKKGLGR